MSQAGVYNYGKRVMPEVMRSSWCHHLFRGCQEKDLLKRVKIFGGTNEEPALAPLVEQSWKMTYNKIRRLRRGRQKGFTEELFLLKQVERGRPFVWGYILPKGPELDYQIDKKFGGLF